MKTWTRRNFFCTWVGACLLLAGLAVAENKADISAQSQGQPPGPAAQKPNLEFWPQVFARDNPVAAILNAPLIRDEELKQFKILYYTKLGEGMDVTDVDAKMEAAFRRYNETQDRAQLMADLHSIDPLLSAYVPPAYAEEQFVYVAMGDSISQGGGASPASHGWVYTVAKRLSARYPNARVRNLAVGGKTTQHARDTQLPDALKSCPDLVTYAAGMNDLQYGEPAEKVRENTEAVIEALRTKTHARIVMMLMPPADCFPAFSLDLPNLNERKKNVTPERVAEFNAVLEELARKYNVKLVRMGDICDQSAGQAALDRLFSFDGVHPNNAGHDKITDIFWKGIEEVLAE